MSAAWKSMKSFLSTFPGKAAVATAATYGIVKAVQALSDKYNLSYDSAIKNTKANVEAYKSTKSELEELKSQADEYKSTLLSLGEKYSIDLSGTDTIDEMLSKLQNSDTIIQVIDQAEISKIETVNAALERQTVIKEKLAEYQQREAAYDARDALQRTHQSVAQDSAQRVPNNISLGMNDKPTSSQGMSGNVNITKAIKEDIKNIQEYKDEIAKLEESMKNLDPQSKEWKQAEKDIKSYDDEIKKLTTDLNENESDLNDIMSAISVNGEGVEALKGFEKEFEEVKSTFDAIYDSTLTSSGKAAEALSKIWKNDSFAKDQQKLVDAFRSGKDISVKDIAKDFPELTAACEEAGVSVETLRDELIALSSQSGAVTKLEDDFNSFKNTLVSAINSVDTINASLANSFSGKGLSVEFDEETGAITGDIENIKKAYQDLDGYDASVLFEKTANGVHLNREALRQLQAQQESLQKKTNLEKIIDLHNRLNQAIAERDSKKKGSEDYNALDISVSNLEDQLEIAQELAAAYDGSTSAYQKWVNAQSSGEEGDMFRSVSETMRERGKELYKEGRYNTNEFRAIADYFSNQDLSTASVEELVRAYESAKPTIDSFFTGSKEGIDRFVASMKQLSDSENLGWIEELDSGKLKFNTGSDEEIAEKLGISKEAVQALYRAMTEYTDDFVIGDTSGIQDFSSSIDEMKQKADEAKSHLKELSNSNLDLNFNFDSTDIDDLDEQIKRATSNLDQFKNQDGNVDLSNGAEDAVAILQTLVQQRQIASQPAIMTIDTSGLDENVANVISKLKEYQTAVNELNALNDLQSAGIQVDTSQIDGAKEKVDRIFSEIQGMSSNEGKLDINAEVSVDTSSMESLDSSLAAITPPEIKAKIVPDTSGANDVLIEDKEATVKFNKDSSEPDNYKPKDKTAKVKYSVDASKVDSWKAPNKTGTLTYNIKTEGILPKDISRTVTYDIKTNGKGPANGTAHANGNASYIGSSLRKNYSFSHNAHANGNWGLQQNENGSIINELGSEIIVRDGQWFILNDGYPTLTDLKKGDIIFNHKQSEQILKNGYVTGSHAKLAYSNGSAFSAGSWTMGNTGNGNLKGGGSYPSSKKKSSSKSSPSPSSSSNDTSEKADDFKETIDYIETAIDRIERQIKNLERIAGSAYNTFSKRNKALKDQISSVTKEIETQQAGYDRYIQQANSVSLSQDYKNKVMDGTIDIETITDENLAENIKEFKQW